MRPLKLFICAFIFFLITSGSFVANAYVVDVYFDDGSVLHNATFFPEWNNEITVKYENDFFALNFKDLKTLEFKVEPINADYFKKTFPEKLSLPLEKLSLSSVGTVTLKVTQRQG